MCVCVLNPFKRWLALYQPVRYFLAVFFWDGLGSGFSFSSYFFFLGCSSYLYIDIHAYTVYILMCVCVYTRFESLSALLRQFFFFCLRERERGLDTQIKNKTKKRD